MCQVDGERVVTEPDQNPMRKQLLEERRKEQRDGGAHDEERGRAAVEIGPFGDNEAASAVTIDGVDKEFVKAQRPGSPILMLSGVGANVATDEEDEWGEDVGAKPLVL